MKNHERLKQKNTINFLSVIDSLPEQEVLFKPVELIEPTKKENIIFDEDFPENGFKIIKNKKLDFAPDYFETDESNCFVNFKRYRKIKNYFRGKNYNVKIRYTKKHAIEKKSTKVFERKPPTIKFIGEVDSKNHNTDCIRSILKVNKRPVEPRKIKKKEVVYVDTSEFANIFSSVLEDIKWKKN